MSKLAKIRIVGKTHRVVYLPVGHEDLKDGNDPCVGRIDHDALKILVEKEQPLAAEQDTILHEVFHGVERAMNLELPEDVIHRLATGVLAVLKDNPELMRYLAKK